VVHITFQLFQLVSISFNSSYFDFSLLAS